METQTMDERKSVPFWERPRPEVHLRVSHGRFICRLVPTINIVVRYLNLYDTQTALTCPTAQTQEKSLYPKLLSLLRPYSFPSSANILGWHAEGSYLQLAKHGAFLLTAPEGYKSFENLYGADNLADGEDWLMSQGICEGEAVVGVRMLTAAPEVEGVMGSISGLIKRGIVFSIGHRFVGITASFRATILTYFQRAA